MKDFTTEGERVSFEPKKYDYDKMIDCAAIRTPDNRIWTGKRHGHCIQTIVQAYEMSTGIKTKKIPEGSQQGFVTMSKRFVDRKEAAMIAVHAGQVKGRTLPFELFSEDLY
jgi:hypothetical protein